MKRQNKVDQLLRFKFKGKKYSGASALDVVRAMEGDTEHYPHRGQSIRRFLRWSLERLYDSLPPRDLDLSDRLGDDELALSYLYLRDEYGAGKLSISQNGIGPVVIGREASAKAKCMGK